MTQRRTIQEAQDDFARLVREVEEGGSVEITRLGQPVAVLLSVGAVERLRSGTTGFWDATMRFRREADLEVLELADAVKDVRDPSTGRSVEL